MGVIPNQKMAFIFPISCILVLIFPILIKYFPKCVGKGSFPKSQIKSLLVQPRKTRPFIIERVVMGRKESNHTNKQKVKLEFTLVLLNP